MPYYIRVLAEKDGHVPVTRLEQALSEIAPSARIALDDGTPEQWVQLLLAHADGTEIAVVERNPVLKGELGAEELQEFIEAVADEKPASAAHWLQSYLPSVKVIYAIQILNGTYTPPGWEAVRAVHLRLWEELGGILQADGEGFSNLAGQHILWQFSDSAKGSWEMAVLDAKGKWHAFKMELGNRSQRAEFLEGNVPRGATRL